MGGPLGIHETLEYASAVGAERDVDPYVEPPSA